jgi:Domain of unknown function (DUF4169)
LRLRRACYSQTDFVISAPRAHFVRGLILFPDEGPSRRKPRETTHAVVKFSFAPNWFDDQISTMEAGLGDVVNLKRFKKRGDRELSAKKAEANRTRFGRTKSERVLDQRRAERASDLLDQHRIDGEDAS